MSFNAISCFPALTAEHPEVDFRDAKRCSFLDVLSYEANGKSEVTEGKLGTGGLEDWFSRDLTVHNQSPEGGLRLIIVDCAGLNSFSTSQQRLQITGNNDSFPVIEAHNSLPRHFSPIITSSAGLRGMSFSPPSSSGMRGLIFKLPWYYKSFLHLEITYSPETKITYALLLSKPHFSSGVTYVPPLVERLKNQIGRDRLYMHPLQLPLLAIELELETANEKLQISDHSLNDLEEALGQHENTGRPKGNLWEIDSGDGAVLWKETASLNHISKRVNVDEMRVGMLLAGLRSVGGWDAEHWEDEDEDEDQDGDGEVRRRRVTGVGRNKVIKGERAVTEKIAHLKDCCRALLLMAQYEEKRTKTLIQVVYQFMTQKDSKVNISLASSSSLLAAASKEDSAVMRSIAVETQRDSAAMKTISILGMFFLPGTFVAALFAIPSSSSGNGNGNGNSSGGGGGSSSNIDMSFKVYWAVTLPLTVAVFVFWAVVMLIPWAKWLERFEIYRGLGFGRKRLTVGDVELTVKRGLTDVVEGHA